MADVQDPREVFVLMLQGKATTEEYVTAVKRWVAARRKAVRRGP